MNKSCQALICSDRLDSLGFDSEIVQKLALNSYSLILQIAQIINKDKDKDKDKDKVKDKDKRISQC